ncbi:hypothetical protein ELQ92_13575 [Labedella populi]|uniref:Uncharacterized protein n=1 Tax=Labedella populi TaxID=2498850 RepID=A0A3S4BYK1_9MICO|nr:hypothetical protein [Labedella populi]RWZ59282.1 hypothetical protein ELQ92_13575 [Labedella populi]
MASDRSDDIDHLDFETPSDLERQFAAPAARRDSPVTPIASSQRPEPDDDDDEDGPTRLPSYRRRRAIMFLVAIVLLVALFLSSGILSLFRQAPAPTDDGDRTVNATRPLPTP